MQTEGEKLPSSSVGANGTCKRRLSDTSLSSQARRESDPGKQLPEGSQEEDAQKNEHAESEPPSQPQLQQDPPTAAESLTLNRNKSILERLREWDPAVELPNKGAVARDHLANERTFLAWLRTSLSLASVGVAVTQLFRLHAAVYTDTSKDSSAFDPSDTPTASPSTTSLAPDVVASAIASLSASVEYQSQILMQYSKTSEDDRHVFSHLGKPIGATLIAVSMVLLCLGVWRFFLVQRTLTQDLFPPARISIIVSAFLIGSIIVAAFAVIMALQ